MQRGWWLSLVLNSVVAGASEPYLWTPEGLLSSADVVAEADCVDGGLALRSEPAVVPFLPWGLGASCTRGRVLAFLRRDGGSFALLPGESLWPLTADGGVIAPPNTLVPASWTNGKSGPWRTARPINRDTLTSLRLSRSSAVVVRTVKCSPCWLRDFFVAEAFGNEATGHPCSSPSQSCLRDGGVWLDSANSTVFSTSAGTFDRAVLASSRPVPFLCGGARVAIASCRAFAFDDAGVRCVGEQSARVWCEENAQYERPKPLETKAIRCRPEAESNGVLFRCDSEFGAPVSTIGPRVDCIDDGQRLRCGAIDDAGVFHTTRELIASWPQD